MPSCAADAYHLQTPLQAARVVSSQGARQVYQKLGRISVNGHKRCNLLHCCMWSSFIVLKLGRGCLSTIFECFGTSAEPELTVHH